MLREGGVTVHGQQTEAVAVLLSVSIVTGAAASKALERGWLLNLLRTLQLTSKKSSLDVWYDVFHEFRDKWLRICYKDGHKIIGWARYFSDDPAKRELFIADPLIEEKDGRYGELEGLGILIENMDAVLRIEVLCGERKENNTREVRHQAHDAKADTEPGN
jgi:hypothetical protein